MNPIDQLSHERSTFMLMFEPPGTTPSVSVDIDQEQNSVDITCTMPSDFNLSQVNDYLFISISVAKRAIKDLTNDNE